MRVALIATFSTVPRTFRMARTLGKAGHDVHLIEWDREVLKPQVEVIRNVTIVRYRLKAPFSIKAFPLMPIWMVFIFNYLLFNEFDAVQAQNLDNLIPVWLVSKIRHFKIVYDLADFYGDAYLTNIPLISNLLKLIERKLIKNVSLLILVTEKQILQVGTNYLPKKYITIFNTPEISSRIRQRIEERNISSNRIFTLIYAGIFSKDRVRLLFNVIKSVEHDPDIEIIIAGYGVAERSIRNVALKNDKVIFLGKLDYKEVLNQTSNSDVVLLPYDSRILNYKIAMPNKLFEAMACSCVVIAPKNTYMCQIALISGFGICTDFFDIKDIKRAICLLKNNKDLLNKMSEAAFRTYQKKYSWELMKSRLLKFYNEF